MLSCLFVSIGLDLCCWFYGYRWSFLFPSSSLLSLLATSGCGIYKIRYILSCVVYTNNNQSRKPFHTAHAIVHQYRFLTMFSNLSTWWFRFFKEICVLSDSISSRYSLPFEDFFYCTLINAFLGLYPTCIWGSISKTLSS